VRPTRQGQCHLHRDTNMRVLLIKLPEDLSEYILLVLKVRWPDVTPVHAGNDEQAVQLLHRDKPGIAMLHLTEPDYGIGHDERFALIARIRAFSQVPLIVVGESENVMDKVKCLETGADEWVYPSFVPMEFIAKVNAILRRCSPERQGVSSIWDGRLSIDHAARRVYVSGKTVELTPIQYEILSHLVKNAGRVCTSEELLRHVWGPTYGDERELLKLSVHRLRSRIEEDPSNPELIINERGIGYVIRAPASVR